MHTILSLYLSDVVEESTPGGDLPKDFTDSVARAVIVKDDRDYVCWSDFLAGFPVAIRQRHVLWEQYKVRPDLRLN